MDDQSTPVEQPPVFGPYAHERDTYDEPLPREVTAAPVGFGRSKPIIERHLAEACRAAGVELGSFDVRILTWLSGYEPSTVQVLIGLISRAYAAGRKAGEQA